MRNARFARYENNPARQLAYQLWAADPTKPIGEVAAELSEVTGENVATRTVYEWQARDNWERRLAEEVLAASGASVFEQVRRLRVAALPAIVYLDNVARGEAIPDKFRIDAAKFIVAQSASVHRLAAEAEAGKLPEVTAGSVANLSTSELLRLAASSGDADE